MQCIKDIFEIASYIVAISGFIYMAITYKLSVMRTKKEKTLECLSFFGTEEKKIMLKPVIKFISDRRVINEMKKMLAQNKNGMKCLGENECKKFKLLFSEEKVKDVKLYLDKLEFISVASNNDVFDINIIQKIAGDHIFSVYINLKMFIICHRTCGGQKEFMLDLELMCDEILKIDPTTEKRMLDHSKSMNRIAQIYK